MSDNTTSSFLDEFWSLCYCKDCPLLDPEDRFPPVQMIPCSSSTHSNGIMLEATGCCIWRICPKGAARFVLFPGRSAAGIGGVLQSGCLLCQGLPTQGYLPAASRSLSSAQSNSFWCFSCGVTITSFKSNALDDLHILYKTWREIFYRGVGRLPFVPLKLSSVWY